MNVNPAGRQARHPRLAKYLVVIAASEGGLDALHAILAELPSDFPAAIALVLHRPAALAGRLDPLVSILRQWTDLHIERAIDGARPLEGTVYLAPGDRHLMLSAGKRFYLADGTRIRGVLSSANPLFETAAAAFEQRAIGVVLSGRDHDATDGVQTVASAGGTVIVQDPTLCRAPAMPAAAIATGAVQYVLPIDEIAPELERLVATS